MPVLPTIAAESPTSVTTQGTPQAIASPMTFAEPSPYALDEVAMSKAAVSRGISVRSPKRCTRA